MGFVKILVLVLGLAAVSFAVKFALSGTVGTDPASVSEPKRQLDNVRASAKEIELEQQRSADRADVDDH